MDLDSIETLINYLPLDDLEKEVVNLVSAGKSEEEVIEILIKRFDK